MDRTQKAEAVSALNATLGEVGVVVVTRNLGLSVAQSTDLRQKMRDAGAAYKVTKNRLAKIALKDTDYEAIGDMLTGPVALATSADPVAAAKVAIDFAKANEKLEIVGGAMGTTLLDAEGVKALASMPSLDELRGKIVGLLQAPATKLATVTQAPAAQLARHPHRPAYRPSASPSSRPRSARASAPPCRLARGPRWRARRCAASPPPCR